MELAAILVVVTFVNLALDVWLIARHRLYLAEIRSLRRLVLPPPADGMPTDDKLEALMSSLLAYKVSED